MTASGHTAAGSWLLRARLTLARPSKANGKETKQREFKWLLLNVNEGPPTASGSSNGRRLRCRLPGSSRGWQRGVPRRAHHSQAFGAKETCALFRCNAARTSQLRTGQPARLIVDMESSVNTPSAAPSPTGNQYCQAAPNLALLPRIGSHTRRQRERCKKLEGMRTGRRRDVPCGMQLATLSVLG